MSKIEINFNQTPGDYTYDQNEYGKHASGVVAVGATSDRNNSLQRSVGGEDREPGDHGGHLIAHSLGGRNDETNLDPQNANVNQIGQRSVERDIANLAKDPNKTVFMDVQNYSGSNSQRPDATMMTVAVQDKTTGQIDVQHYSFQNASYEEQEQWNAIANEDVQIDPSQDAGMTPEQRALANEYADEPYDIPLGQGHTTFLDPSAAPVAAETGNGMDDGVSLGAQTATAADQDYDDGISLGTQDAAAADQDYDDGVSLGADADMDTGSSQDNGMSNDD